MGHALMRLWCGSRERLWLPDREASSNMGPRKPRGPRCGGRARGPRPGEGARPEACACRAPPALLRVTHFGLQGGLPERGGKSSRHPERERKYE